MIEWVPVLAIFAVLTRELLWVSAAGIFLASLDDMLIDGIWLTCLAFRPQPALPPVPYRPGRFALIIPAWDESEVIGAMLDRLCRTVPDERLQIFVGVYPNDPATLAAVKAVGDPRVNMILTDAPGPTTKADCLNHLWRGVLAHEGRTGERFKAVILHDAEDVVDPTSLDLYDRCMPDLAMVQVPVLPIQDPATCWVSGHYCDEFAQGHAKEMIVRGLLGAPVPSAGVGTAIDRNVLALLAGADNAPFDAASLTEDYEIGHRIHRLGLKGRMVRAHHAGRLVATRAYFPSTIETAVRQKSRWLTGISLSGWDRLGWTGGFAARWMLWRDRKSLLTSALAMLTYLVAALLLIQLAIRSWISAQTGVALPPILGEPGPILSALLLLNVILLSWRLGLRAWFTGRAYGWREGLRAIPRAVMANAINFLSALKAAQRYLAILAKGGPPTWGKTAHRFPERHMEVAHG